MRKVDTLGDGHRAQHVFVGSARLLAVMIWCGMTHYQSKDWDQNQASVYVFWFVWWVLKNIACILGGSPICTSEASKADPWCDECAPERSSVWGGPSGARRTAGEGYWQGTWRLNDKILKQERANRKLKVYSQVYSRSTIVYKRLCQNDKKSKHLTRRREGPENKLDTLSWW